MVSRRQLLASLAGATVGLSGCFQRDDDPLPTPTPPQTTGTGPTVRTEPSPRPSLVEQYGTVHDLSEVGVDSAGDAVVDDALLELAADDTLLYFPEGRYRVTDLLFEDRSNLGLFGDGATFVVDTKGQDTFLKFRGVSDVHLEGFRVDNTSPNTAAHCDFKCVGGTNVIRNYTVDGFVDVDERTNGFTLMVEGRDTSLTLENVDLSRGAINAASVFVFPRVEFYDPERRAGSLTFRNCVMSGWGKEGLYASAHSGPLNVIGGRYSNNAIAQVRVGGGNAPTRAVVRGVTVEVTGIPDYMPEGNRILRGIWLKEGDGVLVEDCDIVVRNVGHNETQGGIIVNEQFGRATIRNCRLTTNVQRPAIQVDEPVEAYDQPRMRSLTRLPESWDVECRDLVIRGESHNTPAIDVSGGRYCEFSNVSIDKHGQASDGIQFEEVDSFRIDDSDIAVSRFPVVVGGLPRTDTCVFRLANTSLDGNDLSHVGSRVATAADGVFCLGQSTISGRPSTGRDVFAFTRTEGGAGGRATTEGSGRETTGDGPGTGWVLFGRWFDGP